MTQQETKSEQFVTVQEGICEHCGYEYAKDHLTISADAPLVKCPNCGKYSQNFEADYSHISQTEYDYEKENNKKCPVCGKIINYHIDGLIHYKAENVWVHRDHTAEEAEKALKRPLTEMERAWIEY